MQTTAKDGFSIDTGVAWGDGSAMQSSGCSFRGPGFHSWHSHSHLQLQSQKTQHSLSSYLASTGLVMHVAQHIHAGKNVYASFKNGIIKLSRKQGIHEGQPKSKQNNKPSLAMKDSVKL